MPRIDPTNLQDARLDVYRNLKHTNATRRSGVFVAEGDKLVDRLLASGLPIESLLVAERWAERYLASAPADTAVFIMPEPWIERLVGFNFHRGVLACGVRRPAPSLPEFCAALPERATLVVCPEVHDPENLGAILRIGSALGVQGVLLGNLCCDPFSRRVLRVSMGATFQLPVISSASLREDLIALRRDAAIELWATVLDADAEPLGRIARPARLALLLGSEGHGLGPEWTTLCDRRVTIPMRPGPDSLNVAVAAGIFLYSLCAT